MLPKNLHKWKETTMKIKFYLCVCLSVENTKLDKFLFHSVVQCLSFNKCKVAKPSETPTNNFKLVMEKKGESHLFFQISLNVLKNGKFEYVSDRRKRKKNEEKRRLLSPQPNVSKRVLNNNDATELITNSDDSRSSCDLLSVQTESLAMIEMNHWKLVITSCIGIYYFLKGYIKRNRPKFAHCRTLCVKKNERKSQKRGSERENRPKT